MPPSLRSAVPTASPRRPLALALLALAALQVTLAFVWMPPGPLSIDEVLYQWTTRSAAAGSPLHVLNGYEELPSPELATVRYMRVGEDHLTAQYPVLWPMVAAPLYDHLGFRALFLLNALAFCGVLLFTWRIGRTLLDGPGEALAACVVLGAGTFAWEYSLSAWPHMATLLLQLAAFDAMLGALGLRGEPVAAGVGSAFLAGLLAALAVGFRRDAVFLLPVLALAAVYARPPRFRALGALVLGTVPPFLLVAWLNWLRWGVFSPLSYGRAEPRYRVVAVVGVLGLLALAALARPDVRARVLGRPRLLVLAGAVVCLATLLHPATRVRALTAAWGVENVLFDLRGARSDTTTWYWAVIWFGGLKKSLLQSLPWLPLLAIPAWIAWRRPERRGTLALLLLPVAVYAAVPVLLNRHGGMSLNLRYLVPALPFLSLLAARALFDVVGMARTPTPPDASSSELPSARSGPESTGASRRSLLLATGTGAAMALAGWLVLRPGGFVAREAERAVLDAPLVIAVVLSVAVIAWLRAPARDRPAGPGTLPLMALAALALGWSALMAFDYDARWSRQVRLDNLARSEAVAEHVTEGSLLFAESADWHGTVPELREGVIVAFPRLDDFGDMGRLAHHHLARGRRVFAALGSLTWEEARKRGAMEGLTWRRVGTAPPGLEVREILGAPASSGKGGVAPVDGIGTLREVPGDEASGGAGKP